MSYEMSLQTKKNIIRGCFAIKINTMKLRLLKILPPSFCHVNPGNIGDY